MLKRLGLLLLCIAVPLAVGGLSAIFNMEMPSVYDRLDKPPLSPPGYIFPAVWSVLYALMGWATYLVITENHEGKVWKILYGLTLVLNFGWSFIFFKWKLFYLGFLVILAMWMAAVLLIRDFHRRKPLAAYLIVPYLLWVTYAGYLAFGIAMLN